MNILADRQIPLFNELFSCLGDTHTYVGRTLSTKQLANIDVLITRSTVMVNESLLANSSVRFVGTCTIGTDHLDTTYLDQQGIAWAHAPGCNANAVVQYVLSAMALLAPDWLGATVGIIACGRIGGRVYQTLKALGVHSRVYDPFLSAADTINLSSLDNVLQSDIVISHAPLTRHGPHPTWHLLGEKQLKQLRPGTLLISAGRGAVIDNRALLQRLSSNNDIQVVLDVWENEPDILTELLPLVDIATPHIAGHTLEGKERGTVMIYDALCKFLQCAPPIDSRDIMHSDRGKPNLVTTPSMSAKQLLNKILLSTYDIKADDERLRQWHTSGKTIADYFDHLRRNYPVRREYSHFIFPECAQSSPIQHWLSVLTER